MYNDPTNPGIGPSANPYRPSTQQNADWERRRQGAERERKDQIARGHVEAISRISRDQTVAMGRVEGGHGPSGEGGLTGLLIELSAWYVDHIWPLRQIVDFGVRLSNTGMNWKVNGPLAFVGMGLVPTLFAGSGAVWPGVGAFVGSLTGAHTATALLALGALMGWFAVPVLGVLIAFPVMLIGVGLAVATVAGVCYGGWLLLKAWLDGA